MDKLAILYVGNLHQGGTCLDRFRVLKRLGMRMIPFDIQRYMNIGNKITSSLMCRFNWGWPIRRLNLDLVDFCHRLSGIDIVWVDKGRWIKPESLQTIKSLTGAKLIHFTPDTALVYGKSRLFEKSIPFYDLLVTTKGFETNLYRQAGAKRIVVTVNGCDETRFFPMFAEKNYSSDVCFIGRFEPFRAKCIRSIVTGDGIIRVNGPSWNNYAKFAPWTRNIILGGPLWGESYPKALCGAKIGLCLLTKYFPEQSTSRTFEIPFCGVFMLAERTEEHLNLFQEGKEAEFFNSIDELKDKIGFYLRKPGIMKNIALAGRRRCLESHYGLGDTLKKLIQAYINDKDGS